MSDSAHDAEHIYRVLNNALHIAEYESGVDIDLLTAACLLHDIGRAEQFADPKICHAACGAQKAYKWLVENGYSEEFSKEVKNCIETHRFRSAISPRSIEAKILFDADNLDVCGAVGIARTLLYAGHVSTPLYALTENGDVSDGSEDTDAWTFFREYKFKLEKACEIFYTKRGSKLSVKRRNAARKFYEALLAEVRECYADYD